MEQALFAPQTGYYSSQLATVGRKGDFSTSATLCDLLGRAVAAWLASELGANPGITHVIEVGGGDGSLSAAVRKSIGWWKCRRLVWHMVETSPVLAAQQVRKIGGSAARWHQDIGSALEAAGGDALIFHNELVDAFPVRVLQWNADVRGWHEAWVRSLKGHWIEDLGRFDMNLEARPVHSALQAWHRESPPPHPSQRIELHAAYRSWLHQWAPRWKAGAMLTIDYGDVFPALYHRQPRGTLRAYYKHQRLTGPDVYARMGKQDLTTDVNFTDLEAWGRELNWENAPLQTQREFLLRMVPELPKDFTASPAAAFVLDEHGAGGAFKVLVQRVPQA